MRKLLCLTLLFLSPFLYASSGPGKFRVMQQALEKNLPSSALKGVAPRRFVFLEKQLVSTSVARSVRASKLQRWNQVNLSATHDYRPLSAIVLPKNLIKPVFLLSPAMIQRHGKALERLVDLPAQSMIDEWITSSVFLYAWNTETPFYQWPMMEKMIVEHEFLSLTIRSRHLSRALHLAVASSQVLPKSSSYVLPCGRSVFWEEFLHRRIIRMPDGSLASAQELLQNPNTPQMLEEWMSSNGYQHRDLQRLSRMGEADFAARFNAWYEGALAQVSALDILGTRMEDPYLSSVFSMKRLSSLVTQIHMLEHLTDENYTAWLKIEPYSSQYRALVGRLISHYERALKSADALEKAKN